MLRSMNATTETDTPKRPVSEEVLQRARAAVKEYYASCFWFWNPSATIDDFDDVLQVVENLRKNGDKSAWRVAQELSKCL